jgi:opacity protein-like surface antigen
MKQSIVWLFTLVFILQAQNGFAARRGAYLDLHGGPTSVDTMDFGEGKIAFDNSSYLGAAAGYDFGFFRMEGEYSYRSNDVDHITVFGTRYDSSGKVTLAALMFNMFLEYDNSTPLIPYLGLGLGWGKMNFDDVSGGGVRFMLGDDTGGVTQIMLGLGYALNDRCRLYADYREVMVGFASEDDPDNENTDDDYFNSSLTLGISYYF